MPILKVLNVSNGDCMIITPPNECRFNNTKIIIDLGYCCIGQKRLSQNITSHDNVHIFITHSHIDHFGGIKFFDDKVSQIQKITLPFYQNEIVYMVESILNLKGMRSLQIHRSIVNILQEIRDNQLNLKHLILNSHRNSFLSFAYEGKHFCHHINCLNPPIIIRSFDWILEASHGDLIRVMHELFDENFANQMSLYIDSEGNRPPLNGELTLEESEDEADFQEINTDEVRRRKASYVINFIMHNLELFRSFNIAPNKRITLKKIFNNFTRHIHDTCIVLRANYEGHSFLLTGDASQSVFERLISENKNISANYLKMPHHGSKENINEEILDIISPEAVIISHNNHKHHNHPSPEIIDLLAKKDDITVMVTNDVIKDGVTLMRKANHLGDHFVEIS